MTDRDKNGNQKAEEKRERSPAGDGGITGREVRIVTILLLVGLILRLVYILMVRDHLLFHEAFLRAEWFRDWASRLDRGKPVWTSVPEHMPFYGYLQFFLLQLSDQNFWPLYILQTGLGLGAGVLVFLLTRRLFPPPADKLSLALFLIFPEWIVLETRPVPTILFVFLILLGLYLFVRAREAEYRTPWLIASGGTLALLTATELMGLVVPVILSIRVLVQSDFSWKNRFLDTVSLGGGSLLVIALVLLFNHQAMKLHHPHGGLILQSDTGRQVYAGNGPEAAGHVPFEPGVKADRIDQLPNREGVNHPVRITQMYFKKTFNYVMDQPGSFLENLVRKGFYLITSYTVDTSEPLALFKKESVMFGYGVYPFGLLVLFAGIGGIAAIPYKRNARLLVLLAGCFIALLFVFPVDASSRLVLVPFLAIFAGEGCLYSAQALQERNYVRLIMLLPVFIISFVGFLPLFGVRKAEEKAYRTPVWKAKALWNRGEELKALKTLERARTHKESLWTRNIYIHYELARALFRFEQLKESGDVAGTHDYNVLGELKSVSRVAQELDVTFPKAYDLLGEYYTENGNLKLALKNYRTAMKMVPAQHRMASIGEVLIRSERYQDGIEEMDRALDRYPDCDECRINLARALSLQVISRHRSSADSDDRIKNPAVLMEAPKYNRALTILQDARDRANRRGDQKLEARASFLMGYLYERAHQTDRAHQQLKRARNIGGTFGERAERRERKMWLQLADKLMKEQKFEQAVKELDRALESFPDCDRCRLEKARALVMSGQFNRALEEYHRIVRRARKQGREKILARALFMTGGLLLEAGDLERALHFYNKAKKFDNEFGNRAKEKVKELKRQSDAREPSERSGTRQK